MAALIGFLDYGHHAGVVHRLAHRTISATLKTWQGEIGVTLNKDGTFYVSSNGKDIAKGNVNTKDIEITLNQ